MILRFNASPARRALRLQVFALNSRHGSRRNHRFPFLFDALDQRLGVVAKTQAGLEDIAFLQVAKCEVVLNLLVDAVHAVFDCDFFMLFLPFVFLLLV